MLIVPFVRFLGLALLFAAVVRPFASPAAPTVDMFGKGHARFHATELAPYRFENTTIRLRFDFARGIVYGDERIDMRIKNAPLRALPFNSLGIHYSAIRIDGRPASYVLDGAQQLLNVSNGTVLKPGQRVNVDFQYWTKPDRGIYFVRPDKGYPDITPEIWSQGEAVDNRRWFPTWDEPNEKTPSELTIDVPRGWTVVANGYLKAHTRSALGETWDWRSPQPKSTYLIAFVAGPLTRDHHRLGNLDVDSFVQPPLANLNSICFGRTADMVDYYGKRLGVPYPFSKYDQTTAERFIYGGMENESAATQTVLALHPQIEDAERSCDELVSHELAQNWFGDDATMADWSNAWLNEGFATYFDELWTEHTAGENAFDYRRYQGQLAYLEEAREYRRPIVDYVYNDPIDLLDTSGHERAAQVIHMLRYLVGDTRFYAALHDYLLRYAYRNATTHQFFQSIGASLHTNLSWFEQEWFYRACIPHYIVSDVYSEAIKTLRVQVRQENCDGKPFSMPVVVEAFWGNETRTLRQVVDTRDSEFTFDDVSSRPNMILFDPNAELLRTLSYEKPLADLIYQLRYAPYVSDREWALAELLKRGDNSEAATIGQAVLSAVHGDSFYGVRADAVAGAAELDDSGAVMSALGDPDKRVRIAAEVASAGLVHPTPDVDARLSVMASDRDPIVAAAALSSLGTLHAAGAHALLLTALDSTSFRQAVAVGALQGLAAEGDPSAWPLILARTAYGTQEQERNAALVALARLAQHLGRQGEARAVLVPLLEHDPLIGTRTAAARALGALGDPKAIPALRSAIATDPQFVVQDVAWEAINSLTSTPRQ